LQNAFCNSKMTLTNFQNSWQCWINPTTQLKTTYILVRCNIPTMIGPNWLHATNSMDELHPPMCHVIWGCGIGIMTIFQLYYNQCNIGTCHVIEEGHGILEFWLLFNYIIPNGTLTHVTWAFMVHHQTKLFDMCHVYGFKILKLLIYWKC
jgi:hypothetical protein